MNEFVGFRPVANLDTLGAKRADRATQIVKISGDLHGLGTS